MLLNVKSLANAVNGWVIGFDGSDWVAAPPGSGSITEITSEDGSVTITDPTGPTTDLSVLPVTLALSYNGVGPFDVPVSSMPSGWDGSGIATLGVELTTGDGLITGLEDPSGNPIPDGWSFAAFVFVEDSYIYDIIAVNPWTFANGGIVWWNEGGGMPTMAITSETIVAPNMPTSDPGVAGALWGDSGVVHISAG